MSDSSAKSGDPEKVSRFTEQAPPAFAPGHAGMLQMAAILIAEVAPSGGNILVVGAGSGLEIRYFASVEAGWRFVGVDPAAAMRDLARAVAAFAAGNRMTLIEGNVKAAPSGPFDASTCILVLGLVKDDGAKPALLSETRGKLKAGAPFILVDQCIDLAAADAGRRLDRDASFARRSGVDPGVVAGARAAVGQMATMVPDWRNVQLLEEAGFRDAAVFYGGMAWRGWVAYA